MAPSTGPRATIRLDRAHLALALAIVKDKPPDTEVKDYISRIRNFIKSQKELDMSRPEKFFDSVNFWKSAYEKSEAEHAKLLNAMYDLEQRNLNLLTKTKLTTSGENTSVPSSTKRKASGVLVPVAPSQINSKRARSNLSKNPSRKDPGAERQDAEFTHDEKRTTSFMRQIYNMQRALQKRRNEKNLATNAVILCKEAEHSFLDLIQLEVNSKCQTNSSDLVTTEQSTSAIFGGVELAFHLAYRALHKINNAGDTPGQGKGQIIYYIVCLFESITVGLTQYCTAISNPRIETEKTDQLQKSATTQVRRSKTEKRAQTITQSHIPTKGKDEVAQELTKLLCKMATSLDLTKEDDQKIMEGFLFIVLGRVGKMLALFVFKDIQLPLEACPELKLPEGLASMHQEGLSPDIGKCEASYLVKLLKGLFTNEASSTPEYSATKAQFVRGMKDQFQETLLQAVFGMDEPLFQGGLKRPATPPPQDCDGNGGENFSFSEWFTQELWSLVGWDMLNSIVDCR
ncbi:hypothetical protein N7481_010676 [Penicillium waksmanii]|uniref:uncharacterized protein n=1 Tax=Penicillium waksmanii TaxID=69791 RepID=UPI0025466AD7|nr:uncharacterized protein N7481_010676 [Penicillium waksmanii]KAJ5973466.1 hypothetical protein N7481_010676 [Penicillium waksmanii]